VRSSSDERDARARFEDRYRVKGNQAAARLRDVALSGSGAPAHGTRRQGVAFLGPDRYDPIDETPPFVAHAASRLEPI
jgi:hypothetical protein